MSRHRYPGWKSGLREGCQLISHIPSHTGSMMMLSPMVVVVVVTGYGGDDDNNVNNIDGF